jgi:lipopolysaccharide biosynthesis glycosyltransferase
MRKRYACVALSAVALLVLQGFQLRDVPIARDTNCSSWTATTTQEQHTHSDRVSICLNEVARTSDIAIATMLTDHVEAYGLGALKLIASIQRRADTPAADFLLLELAEKPLPAEIRETLVYGGWRPCVVHRIPAREPVVPRFADQFTKLVLWRLVEYARVVYLDSDCVVTGTLKPLLQRNLSGKPIWAAMDLSRGQWGPGFNMGVFAIEPSAEEFARLMRLKESGVEYDTIMSEQGFLNVVYRCVWGDIGFVNNANLAAYLDDRRTWDRHAEEVNVIHYTMWKPFEGGSWEYAAPVALWNNVRVYPTLRERRRCPVTFVTQYFAFPSKHSQEEYSAWMSHIHDTDMCLVVFSDEVDRFQSGKNRVVVQVELEAAAAAFNQTLAFWQAQHERDRERDIHRGYRLYWVWNLKSVFLQRAADDNPFDSQYFFWIDSGCVRGTGRAEKRFQWSWFWPPRDVMLHHKIFVAVVNPFLPSENAETSFEDVDRLSGAVWGGHRDAVRAWGDAYMTVFADYVARGRFVGKDQSLMTTACLRWPGLCQMLDPDRSKGDVFFYILPYLRTCTQCSAAYTHRDNQFSNKPF